MKIANIEFPEYRGVRCLMMPYVQGDPDSLPQLFRDGYGEIISRVHIEPGKIGFLTIDESPVKSGVPHRGYRAAHARALHTEAGRRPGKVYAWGSGGGWGRSHRVELDRDVQVLLANSVDDSCALWDDEQENTTTDGDIGHLAGMYPYTDSVMMKAGEVHKIGILTPHESLPIKQDGLRQFIRIVSSGVHGTEPYFTKNPLMT